MSHKKTWSLILKAPALLLLITCFLATIYVIIYNIQDNIGLEVPIILGIVIVLYYIGSKMERTYYNELNNDENKSSEQAETIF